MCAMNWREYLHNNKSLCFSDAFKVHLQDVIRCQKEAFLER